MLYFYLSQIFNDITYLITCCTENEAHRYGRFLCCILEIVMKWRESEAIYKKVVDFYFILFTCYVRVYLLVLEDQLLVVFVYFLMIFYDVRQDLGFYLDPFYFMYFFLAPPNVFCLCSCSFIEATINLGSWCCEDLNI